jgi:hypothetical protein
VFVRRARRLLAALRRTRSACRVEYRDGDGVSQTLARDPTRFRALAADLAATGRLGELVLVDEQTGRVLVRHQLPGPVPGDEA